MNLRIDGMTSALMIAFSMAVTCSVGAQAPHEQWRTIETDHYRVHFPADYEEWARHAASRLESVREIVGREVGYLPEEVIDVVVMDPIARANGSAWPFIGYPRMVLWTSPPGPESIIGHYSDWIELLTIHEQAHLAHLLRPSRNPLQRVLGRTLGLGPIPFRAPRWVSEGYATVIEGDLTGTGRPQSDIRAAILRKWAQEGRLPSYAQMSSDSRSYLGMSMAYLAGSAFLEWLREREGEESFRKVWARLTAKKSRSFEDAFTGVYGDSPSSLYARFRAELTHTALELEELLDPVREGELWQDLSWQTGAPAVSDDGTLLAIVLRGREKPARLVVWETAENEEALEKWSEEVEKLLRSDPEDVAAVRRKPLPRKAKYELVARDRADLLTPRWLPDGSIIFVRFEPDVEGFLHPDLFRWRPESGNLERLTHQADLREPAPVSGGSVIAVRRRFGKSNLVRLDVDTGRIDDVTEPSLSTKIGWPRADRGGKRLVFVRHEQGDWRLSVLDLATGEIRDLPLPPETTTVAYPEWHPDGGAIYATVGAGGLLDIWRFELDQTQPPTPVTRSFGAALAPSLGGDGTRLYFLGLDADGLDLRLLDPLPVEPPQPVSPEVAALVPIARPEVREAEPPTAVDPGPSRPYSIGRIESRWLFGGGRTPSEETWEIGMRFGDLVGKFDSMIVGSVSSGGPQGGSARAVWRGWPVSVEGHLFGFEHERTDSPVEIASPLAPEEDRRGGELLLAWDRQWRGARFGTRGGILVDRVDLVSPEARENIDREIGFVTLDLVRRLTLDPWILGGSANLSLIGGEVDGRSWNGWTAEAGVVGGLREHSLAGWYRRGELDGIGSSVGMFVVGGAPNSLTPSFDHLVRVWSPGLAEGTVTGSNYEGWRMEIDTKVLPVVPFYETHRAGSVLIGEWTSLAGVRFDLEIEPFPLLKVPGATLSFGGAYVLDGPRADKTEWWITSRWRIGQ